MVSKEAHKLTVYTVNHKMVSKEVKVIWEKGLERSDKGVSTESYKITLYTVNDKMGLERSESQMIKYPWKKW